MSKDKGGFSFSNPLFSGIFSAILAGSLGFITSNFLRDHNKSCNMSENRSLAKKSDSVQKDLLEETRKFKEKPNQKDIFLNKESNKVFEIIDLSQEENLEKNADSSKKYSISSKYIKNLNNKLNKTISKYGPKHFASVLKENQNRIKQNSKLKISNRSLMPKTSKAWSCSKVLRGGERGSVANFGQENDIISQHEGDMEQRIEDIKRESDGLKIHLMNTRNRCNILLNNIKKLKLCQKQTEDKYSKIGNAVVSLVRGSSSLLGNNDDPVEMINDYKSNLEEKLNKDAEVINSLKENSRQLKEKIEDLEGELDQVDEFARQVKYDICDI